MHIVITAGPRGALTATEGLTEYCRQEVALVKPAAYRSLCYDHSHRHAWRWERVDRSSRHAAR
jgi:hypothetical protein